MPKIKVLEMCAGLNIGGAQSVAANIARYADKSYIFHYLVFGNRVGEYEKMIEERGNTVIHWTAPSRNFLRFFISLIKLMRQERYDVVHCHNMFNCGIVMLAAKIAGIPIRISHSHTIREECAETFLRKCYRGFMRLLIHLFGTDFLACGVDAGIALYGKSWFNNNGIVIPNGIDISQYRYSDENRNRIRSMYNLHGKHVICHVGHYVAVKNQTFLINLMNSIRQSYPEAILLLFGEGEEREKFERIIRECQLEDYVVLMGNVNNIGQVLSGMDVFVMPSLFEGTPLALIEAQANGLPCIISDAIPMDACLLDDLKRLSLDSPSEQWINAIVNAKRNFSKDPSMILLSRYEDIQSSMARIYTIFLKAK